MFDLLLAAAEAIAMFHLAYPSCKSIGAVLLQTAPARGLSAGRMESFLRAMREVTPITFFLIPNLSLLTVSVARSSDIRKSCTSRPHTYGSSHRPWARRSRLWRRSSYASPRTWATRR